MSPDGVLPEIIEIARASLVRRRAVPSGAEVEAVRPASAVRRLHRAPRSTRPAGVAPGTPGHSIVAGARDPTRDRHARACDPVPVLHADPVPLVGARADRERLLSRVADHSDLLGLGGGRKSSRPTNRACARAAPALGRVAHGLRGGRFRDEHLGLCVGRAPDLGRQCEPAQQPRADLRLARELPAVRREGEVADSSRP